MIAATTCLLLPGNGWVLISDLAKLSVRPHLVVVNGMGPCIYSGEYEIVDVGEHLMFTITTPYDVFVHANRFHRYAASRGLVRQDCLTTDDELYLYDTGKLFHARPVKTDRYIRAHAFDIKLASRTELVVAKDIKSRWADAALCGMVICDSRQRVEQRKNDAIPWKKTKPEPNVTTKI